MHEARYWIVTWFFAIILLCLGLTVNESLLRHANHTPSLVSDADLFCMSYSRLSALGRDDVLLLGASRMQTDFDLEMFKQRYPSRTILQLAQSGRGTAFPVFEDIVQHSTYNGIIIIDETEQTLISQTYDQAGFVEHCHNHFSIDRRLNRQIANWLQSHFVFINSQSSSFRLWGNLLMQGKLPEPFYVETKADRSQLSDFKRAEPVALEALYRQRIDGSAQIAANITNHPTPVAWLAQTEHWQPLIRQFQKKGGRIIFMRMPVNKERWQNEEQVFPVELYWARFTTKSGVDSLHFAEYPPLADFDFPDASHLDKRDRAAFTELAIEKLNETSGLSLASNTK